MAEFISSQWLVLAVITVGCFLAAFVNAAFATGGVYIMLAASSSVLPLTAAVPLQPVFSFASLLGRMVYFWRFINWRIVAGFAAGSVIGVFLGARVFVSLPEKTIATLLGSLLILLIWLPTPRVNVGLKHPFFIVGILHSFLGTLFGVGALLQPAILHTRLTKLEITSTLAGCLLAMDVFKIAGYISYGFDYWQYAPLIVAATLSGILGTWLGKRVTHFVSEKVFRLVFRWLITIVALRLLYKGLV